MKDEWDLRSVSLKVLSFDGDGTLWDFEAVMREALASALTELRRLCDSPRAKSICVDEAVAIRDAVAREHAASGATLEDIRLLSFEALLSECGCPDAQSAKAINEVYFAYRDANIILYDDTIETLDRLRRQHSVGMITNGNTDPARHGLDGLLDFTLFADRCGVAKPDPEIFHMMPDSQDCLPEQAVHVGDSLANDVAGAQRAGLFAVWLNREGEKENRSGIVPDAEIDTLAALAPIVERLGASN